jgi:hypothetical protein
VLKNWRQLLKTTQWCDHLPYVSPEVSSLWRLYIPQSNVPSLNSKPGDVIFVHTIRRQMEILCGFKFVLIIETAETFPLFQSLYKPWKHGGLYKRWSTGWTIGVLGFYSRRRQRIFSFTTASRTALGPIQPPTQWVPGALSLGVKRPGHEADHSPSSAEVKEWVEPYLHSPTKPPWRGARLKHRDTFTFTLPVYCTYIHTS